MIEPRKLMIEAPEIRRQVQDGEFRLVAQTHGRLAVVTTGGPHLFPAIRYAYGQPFAAPFGINLVLKGIPAPGDAFTLITRRPKEFDYAVHDGMVLMPISRAIELVRADPALNAAYGELAARLLQTIETQLIPKWQKYWRETREGGFLVFPTDPWFHPSGSTLPHNQYAPLGTVQLTLYRITGRAIYRERAEKMARFFKSSLRLVDGHYEWHYWDAAGSWDRPWDKPHVKRPEDTGHGSLSVGFALACADAGVVFTKEDLRCLAGTFLIAMWNGSLERPTIGGFVNSRQPTRESENLHEWVMLSKVEPAIQQICERIIPSQGSLWSKAQLYFLWAGERQKAGR